MTATEERGTAGPRPAFLKALSAQSGRWRGLFEPLAAEFTWRHPGLLHAGATIAWIWSNDVDPPRDHLVTTWAAIALDAEDEYGEQSPDGRLGLLRLERVPSGCGAFYPHPLSAGHTPVGPRFQQGLRNPWDAEIGPHPAPDFDIRWSLIVRRDAGDFTAVATGSLYGAIDQQSEPGRPARRPIELLTLAKINLVTHGEVIEISGAKSLAWRHRTFLDHFLGVYLARFATSEDSEVLARFVGNPAWYWPWRFAIELADLPAGVPGAGGVEPVKPEVLARSLGALLSRPVRHPRPNELIWRAWPWLLQQAGVFDPPPWLEPGEEPDKTSSNPKSEKWSPLYETRLDPATYVVQNAAWDAIDEVCAAFRRAGTLPAESANASPPFDRGVGTLPASAEAVGDHDDKARTAQIGALDTECRTAFRAKLKAACGKPRKPNPARDAACHVVRGTGLGGCCRCVSGRSRESLAAGGLGCEPGPHEMAVPVTESPACGRGRRTAEPAVPNWPPRGERHRARHTDAGLSIRLHAPIRLQQDHQTGRHRANRDCLLRAALGDNTIRRTDSDATRTSRLRA